MIPTQQCLDAGNKSRRHVKFRLVVQEQFITVQCLAQIRFQLQPFHGLRLDLAGEETEIVLALLLRGVHCDVGMLCKCLGIAAIRRKQGNTDARGDSAFPIGQQQRLAERGDDIARDFRYAVILRDLAENDDELIAAQPGHHVAVTQATP